jgi:hypothetical protein
MFVVVMFCGCRLSMGTAFKIIAKALDVVVGAEGQHSAPHLSQAGGLTI